MPADATLSVSATRQDDRVSVRVTVQSLPADRDALRLQILLVERELGYVGETGIPAARHGGAGDGRRAPAWYSNQDNRCD